jgi:hypothetical protein
VRLTSTQSFDNKIWSGFNIGKLVQSKFDSKQKLEYFKLTEYSKYLMSNNLNNIKTRLKFNLVLILFKLIINLQIM